MDRSRTRLRQAPTDRALLACWITPGRLREVREQITSCAAQLVSNADRLYDFKLAVNEVVTNVILHGGGSGWLRLWASNDELICEVSDHGPGIANPNVGTVRPRASADGGYGVWLARELCPGMRVRTAPEAGTTVQIHVDLR